jgi:hypothetical protein
MGRKSASYKRNEGKLALGRLTKVANSVGIETEVVKSVIEGDVPEGVSTNTLSSAYKVAETCEAAQKLGELAASSSKASSSSSKKRIREEIVHISESVHKNLDWRKLTELWEALQNKGSSEYAGEV